VPFFNERVPSDFDGILRVDKYVSTVSKEIGRSKLKTGVTKIFINGNPSKLSSKVKADDQIDIEWEENIPDDILPEEIPLDIIYEDDNVTIVNKKQGMVVHPAAGNWNGTLVNALLFHWGRSIIPQIVKGSVSEILAARRPGIVHRLDKDTSGIIITAKNTASENWLQTEFREHRVKKEYIAIVCGRPPHESGDIRTQIIRDPRNRKIYTAVTGTTAGKFARTLYQCIESFGNYSFLRILLKTGRTHQIRVHMKYLGCPILGDPLYGKIDKNFTNATLMLHARMLCIRLPEQAVFSRFISPVPVRFKKVLDILKKENPHRVVQSEESE
jgi:23S rRNA pseudouridine1911/1915/1917 synthase